MGLLLKIQNPISIIDDTGTDVWEGIVCKELPDDYGKRLNIKTIEYNSSTMAFEKDDIYQGTQHIWWVFSNNGDVLEISFRTLFAKKHGTEEAYFNTSPVRVLDLDENMLITNYINVCLIAESISNCVENQLTFLATLEAFLRLVQEVIQLRISNLMKENVLHQDIIVH